MHFFSHITSHERLTTRPNVNEDVAGGRLLFYFLAYIVIEGVADYHPLQEIKAFLDKLIHHYCTSLNLNSIAWKYFLLT